MNITWNNNALQSATLKVDGNTASSGRQVEIVWASKTLVKVTVLPGMALVVVPIP